MKKHWLLLLLCPFALAACLRLDDQLFNNVKLSEYKFDNFTGERELMDLPAQYAVADSLRTLISFTSYSSEGAAKIYAVYIGNLQTINTDTVILYCHGNSKHMDNYWNRAKLLSHIGGTQRYGVLMFDYRGYGMSEGKSSEKNLYADTDAALKWLQSQGVKATRLIVYGYSLGSAPACEISLNNYTLQPSKLILEAPFASSAVMVNDGSALALPSSYFTNAKINNADKIKTVKQPFLWMHGINDDFLSINTHGEVVYKNYGGNQQQAHRIPDAVHNNVPAIWGYTNYLNALSKFVQQ